MRFLQFSYEFFQNFKISLASLVTPPPDPLRGGPPKMFHPEPKSWQRRWVLVILYCFQAELCFQYKIAFICES